MSTLHRARSDSPLLVLVVGLVMIALLQGVALRSVIAAPVLGLALGVAETALARRLSSTPRTRVLRWILAIFGVATVMLALFFAAAHPV